MSDHSLYLAQRLSALVLAPLVVGHLLVIVLTAQGGLTSGEILARTQGSLAWALYYATFTAAVAVHAAIGLRVVMAETLGLGGRRLDLLTLGIFGALLGLGLRATWSVTLG